MSTWEFICKSGWLKIISETCYSSLYFPIEVRGILANWLEHPLQQGCIHNIGSYAAQTQPAIIDGFVREMMNELRRKIESIIVQNERDYFYKLRLDEIIRHLESVNEAQIYSHMKHALQLETLQVNQLKNGNRNNTPPTPGLDHQTYGVSTPQKAFTILDTEISNIIQTVKVQSKQMEKQVNAYSSLYLNLQEKLHELSNSEQTLTSQQHCYDHDMIEYHNKLQQLQNSKVQMQTQIVEAPQKLRELVNPHMESFMPYLEKLKVTCTGELKKFREEQRYVAIGGATQKQMDIEKIEKWYKGLTDCFKTLRESMQLLKDLCQMYCGDACLKIQPMVDKIDVWKNEMIWESLVVETEPCQIIRTATGFGPVRLRVMPCSSNMMIDKASIIKRLVNDVEAAKIVQEKTKNFEYVPKGKGTLNTSKGFPNVENNTIYFKDFKVSLSQPERGIKRGEKSVVEELFYLYFQITVNIEGSLFKLWVVTLPITITSHPTQEGEAHVTLLWDTCLLPTQRKPFSQNVPPNICWTKIIHLIDLMFLKVGKGLSEGSKAYLKTKLFRGPTASDMVTYKQFAKDPLVAVNIDLLPTIPAKAEKSKVIIKKNGEKCKEFSFWMWVWSFLELLDWTPEHPDFDLCTLKYLWTNDRIMGFMPESEIVERLITVTEYPLKVPFILRFPEGRPSSIGLYFLDNDVTKKKLVKLSYTSKDMEKLPLQNRIIESFRVSHLYPDTKREEVFTKISCNKVINYYYIVGLQECWSRRDQYTMLDKSNTNQVTSGCRYSSHNYSSSQDSSPSPSTGSEYSNQASNSFGFNTGSCNRHISDKSPFSSSTSEHSKSPHYRPLFHPKSPSSSERIENSCQALNLNSSSTNSDEGMGDCVLDSLFDDYFPDHDTRMERNTVHEVNAWIQDSSIPSIRL